MTYTITGLSDMGTVTSEETAKDAQLFQMPLPVSDSNQAILLDLFGVLRTIEIKGIFTGTTGDISSFIVSLDALVNGTQSSKTYHSDKSGVDYHVLVQRVKWIAEEGSPSKVNYELSLIEGAI